MNQVLSFEAVKIDQHDVRWLPNGAWVGAFDDADHGKVLVL
jgi:hypothetical protein